MISSRLTSPAKPQHLERKESSRSALISESKNFLEIMRPLRGLIDGTLAMALPFSNNRSDTLAEAMRYAVLGSGGKRLRPLLCILAAEACDGSMSAALPTACALELIHACSLVHDDLPAMDNDALRRGRPSCHIKFGEAVTILVGDALLARAFELMTTPVEGVPPGRLLEMVRLISTNIGLNGMAGGQLADIQSTGLSPDEATLNFIHTRKTGAFIRTTVTAGALLAGADQSQIEALDSYGSAIGHAFQLVDDILNITGEIQILGKPVGSDQARGKATYPGLLGVEETRRLAKVHVTEAIVALSIFDEKADPLRALADYIIQRKH